MPIMLNEILVPILDEQELLSSLPELITDDDLDERCSLCKESLEKDRHSYNPILHTLDTCLKNLFEKE